MSMLQGLVNMVRAVTLCNGIESIIQVYENLGLAHMHVAACEKDKHCRNAVALNFSPRLTFKD
eukprot:10362790-Lingulodinium_polyedra.AAC.1